MKKSGNSYEKDFKEVLYELNHEKALSNSQRSMGLSKYAQNLIIRYIKDQHLLDDESYNKEDIKHLHFIINQLVKETTLTHYKLHTALKQKTSFHTMRKILTDRLFWSSIMILTGLGLLSNSINFTNLFGESFLIIIGCIAILLGIFGYLYDVYLNNQYHRKQNNRELNGKDKSFYI